MAKLIGGRAHSFVANHTQSTIKGERSKSEADPVRVSVGGESHSLRMTDGKLKVGNRAQSL